MSWVILGAVMVCWFAMIDAFGAGHPVWGSLFLIFFLGLCTAYAELTRMDNMLD